MAVTTTELDALMEQASQQLARRDYPACETSCLRALALARLYEQWSYYARILLPLQEVRRQRRLLAAEGDVRLGTSTLAGPVEGWLEEHRQGCIVVTHPFSAEDALALERSARARALHVEVLWADNPATDRDWTLVTPRDPSIRLTCAAPPKAWIDRWLPARTTGGEDARTLRSGAKQGSGGSSGGSSGGGLTLRPGDWFTDATENLGDVALANVVSPPGTLAHLEELERCLTVLTDHEIIHQRLAAAATALARVSP